MKYSLLTLVSNNSVLQVTRHGTGLQ